MKLIKSSRYRLYNEDYNKILPKIKNVDLILCDLPYGTTTVKWDTDIDLDNLWKMYYNCIRTNKTPIILFANFPFACRLFQSNFKKFKHEWIWEKSRSGSAITAKYCPIKIHEYILVFCKGSLNYFPIMEKGDPYSRISNKRHENNHNFGINDRIKIENTGTRYPKTLMFFKQNWSKQQQIHPTQKPVELLEYLIKTYSKENDIVLDNTMGSGTTGVACLNTNRRFIGIEKDKEYFKIAANRLKGVEKHE